MKSRKDGVHGFSLDGSRSASETTSLRAIDSTRNVNSSITLTTVTVTRALRRYLYPARKGNNLSRRTCVTYRQSSRGVSALQFRLRRARSASGAAAVLRRRYIDEKQSGRGSKTGFYLPLNARPGYREKCIPEISHFQVINLQ